MDPAPRRLLPSLLVLLSLACAGCANVPKQSSAVQKADLDVSTAELRMRAVELGRDGIRELEIAADSIDARTTDVRIHRNTLLWRLSVVSATTEAALREDPVVAMVDLYALRVQLEDFITARGQAAGLGDGHPIALRAIHRAAERWEVVAAEVGANYADRDRAIMEEWAHTHPIEGLPFTRASPAAALASKLTATQSGLGAAVGGIQSTLERLEFRASLVNEYAIKQAMWLSRYAALEVGESPQVAELSATMAGARGLLSDAPALVGSERAAVLDDVDRQRLATLETVAQERAILLAAVAAERAIVLAAVSEERRLLMRDVDSLRVRTVDDGLRVIDYLLIRVAALVAALFVATWIMIWLFLRGLRWTPPTRA